MSPPWKLDIPARTVIKAAAPGLVVPPGGWTAATFALHGVALIKAMVRISRIAQKKAAPYIARKADAIFRAQLDLVIDRVLRRSGQRSLKAGDTNHIQPQPITLPTTIEISLPQHEALWAQAIQEVFAEQNLEVIMELVPPIQSVMGQAYGRISALMGQAPTELANQRIARMARDVASKIVRINDTTRAILDREIRQALSDGMTVVETAARLREVVPDLNNSRINTIARTETNNAWNQGTIASFQESETLTHSSVVGCESRETERWNDPSYQRFMYNGQSTCNVKDVPVHDLEKLNWHPNHTGTLIASRFRNDDGSLSNV